MDTVIAGEEWIVHAPSSDSFAPSPESLEETVTGAVATGFQEDTLEEAKGAVLRALYDSSHFVAHDDILYLAAVLSPDGYREPSPQAVADLVETALHELAESPTGSPSTATPASVILSE
jgi:ABC-type Na+ efflux pump permease subunit